MTLCQWHAAWGMLCMHACRDLATGLCASAAADAAESDPRAVMLLAAALLTLGKVRSTSTSSMKHRSRSIPAANVVSRRLTAAMQHCQYPPQRCVVMNGMLRIYRHQVALPLYLLC